MIEWIKARYGRLGEVVAAELDKQGHPYPNAGAELIIKACREVFTINTVEELDDPSLSMWGTLLVEVHHPNDGCSEDGPCWVVPVVWEMVNQAGWMCHTYRREGVLPHLPARVIWHPNWEA